MPRTGKKATPIAKYSGEHRGAASTLTPVISSQIVSLAKRGLTNVEIYSQLGIPEDTFYTWHERNTFEIKDKLGESRRAYLLDVAEQGLTKLAKSKSERIQLDALKYLSERLGKRWYATRQESQAIDPDEGKEIEPENKEKIERLLITKKPLQTKDALPIVSPLQLDTNADK